MRKRNKSRRKTVVLSGLATLCSLLNRNPSLPTFFERESGGNVINHESPKSIEDKIIDQALFHQIIFFGEDHSRGEDKIFIAKLLPRLKKIGYKHLVLEMPEVNQEQITRYSNGAILEEEYVDGSIFKLAMTHPRMKDYKALIDKARALGLHIHVADIEPLKESYTPEQRENLIFARLEEKIFAIQDDPTRAKVIVVYGFGHSYEEGKYPRTYFNSTDRTLGLSPGEPFPNLPSLLDGYLRRARWDFFSDTSHVLTIDLSERSLRKFFEEQYALLGAPKIINDLDTIMTEGLNDAIYPPGSYILAIPGGYWPASQPTSNLSPEK